MDSSKITVLCPTSAIPSHPETTLMDETMAGIRFHFPDSPVLLLADGVWDGIAHRREQYEGYLNRIENRYPNTRVVRFPQHTQQTAMAQYAIKNFVRTSYIFWNEHDAPLRTDRPIDWDGIVDAVRQDAAGLVRFTYFEEGIHEAHKHLARGEWRIKDATFVRTVQFSGWSFLTTTRYRVEKIFAEPPIGKEMLELRMYERVANAPWEQYKVVIYVPDGPAQRFRHSNGRGFGVEERDACDWG